MPVCFEMSYCLRDNTSPDCVSHRAGHGISKWKETTRKSRSFTHVEETGPFLCSRKFGSQTGVTNAISGWPQHMQLAMGFWALVRSRFEPLCHEEEESGATKPRNYDNHRQQKREVSWIRQGWHYAGEAGRHPVERFPQLHVVWRLQVAPTCPGSSHVPWCRYPRNCGCCQKVRALISARCWRLPPAAGIPPMAHVPWMRAEHRTHLQPPSRNTRLHCPPWCCGVGSTGQGRPSI